MDGEGPAAEEERGPEIRLGKVGEGAGEGDFEIRPGGDVRGAGEPVVEKGDPGRGDKGEEDQEEEEDVGPRFHAHLRPVGPTIAESPERRNAADGGGPSRLRVLDFEGRLCFNESTLFLCAQLLAD